MDTLLAILWIVLGLAMLGFGARLLVSSAGSVAVQLRIPAAVVGTTVVAMGTSLPEFTATTIAALRDNAGIAYGNIVGSNIANIMLILGVTALVSPQKARRELVWTDGLWMLVSAGLLALFMFTQWLPGGMPEGAAYHLSRAEGLAMLGALAVFMVLTLRRALKERSKVALPEDHRKRTAGWYMARLGLFLLALALLGFGSDRLVAGAVELAELVGMTQLVIGLTVVAVGTSTPEFAISVTAALKRQDEIAVTNITGSNVLNILFCLAAAMVIAPNGVVIRNTNAGYDLAVLGVVTTVLFAAMLLRGRVDRWLGVVLVAGMVGYTIWLILRGGEA